MFVATHHQYMYSKKFLFDNNIRFENGLKFGEDLVFYLKMAFYARFAALTGGATYYFRSPDNKEKIRPYDSQNREMWADTKLKFENAINEIKNISGSQNLYRKDINNLIKSMTRLSRPIKVPYIFFIKILCLFIPIQKWRKKLRHKYIK